LEGLERLALLGAELLRDLEQQPIAGVAMTALTKPRHAFASQANDLVRLTARGDLELFCAPEHRHVDFRAEGQLCEGDRQVDEQVGAVPRENRMVANAHEHVEIARGAAVDAAAALAGQPQLHAVVDPRRNLDAQDVLTAHPTVAAAIATRVLVDLPLAAAARARPRNGEEAVAHAHLATALARLARRLVRAGLAAAALARLAAHQPRNLDLRLDSRRGLFERELQLVLQILAARRARAAA